jgi:hypothetical protein
VPKVGAEQSRGLWEDRPPSPGIVAPVRFAVQSIPVQVPKFKGSMRAWGSAKAGAQRPANPTTTSDGSKRLVPLLLLLQPGRVTHSREGVENAVTTWFRWRRFVTASRAPPSRCKEGTPS